jgi:hypothetical protein
MMILRWKLLFALSISLNAFAQGYEVLEDDARAGLPGSSGGYSVGGPEFWNYDAAVSGSIDPVFGWDTGSEAAKRCAEQAWRTLKPVLEHPSDPLKLKANGMNRFFVWVDDLQKDPQRRVSARVWHYNANEEGRRGIVKFQSHVDKDGVCHTPSIDDLFAFARNKLRRLGLPESSLPVKPEGLVAIPEAGNSVEGGAHSENGTPVPPTSTEDTHLAD